MTQRTWSLTTPCSSTCTSLGRRWACGARRVPALVSPTPGRCPAPSADNTQADEGWWEAGAQPPGRVPRLSRPGSVWLGALVGP